MGMAMWLLILVGLFIIYSYIINKRYKIKLKEKVKLVKEVETQLIQMEKMASIGTLAAGIAHEINNPLGFLISNLQTLRDSVQNLNEKALLEKQFIDDLRAITQESLEGGLRIKRIVSDLRTFSRRSEAQMILVDINQVLESTLSIIWNEIKYKVSVMKDYQAKTNILADTTQLSQVFLNIIINAGQAIAEKGTVTISTYEDNQNVYVKLSDTGCGIAPEDLSKIFEPFFSTKKGPGLGLSVSYNIIKQHQGEIKVESKTGSGTTFTIALPKERKGGDQIK